MNKTELIEVVAKNTGLKKKDAEAAVAATIAAIQDALVAGEKVQLIGFGSFEVKKRAARTGLLSPQALPSRHLLIRSNNQRHTIKSAPCKGADLIIIRGQSACIRLRFERGFFQHFSKVYFPSKRNL